MKTKKGQFKWRIGALIIAIAFLVVALILITDLGDAALKTARGLVSRQSGP